MDRQPSRNPAFVVLLVVGLVAASVEWIAGPRIVVHILADDGPLTRSAE
jgi:hypothetical protein